MASTTTKNTQATADRSHKPNSRLTALPWAPLGAQEGQARPF